MKVQFSVEKSLPISVIDKIWDIDKIEVADSKSDHGLHVNTLVLKIFAFYYLLEYARNRPGRRNHVHLGQKFLCFRVIKTYEGF